MQISQKKRMHCKCCNFYQCNTNLTIQNFQKLHVNGVEVMHSDIDNVTTGQVMIKGHLRAQFV